MSGIVAQAKKWLMVDKSAPDSSDNTGHQIIESLLAEIKRIEAINSVLSEEVQRLRTDGAKELRLAVAEECAVICETADYVVRSYGCAREIRKKIGIPEQRH